MKSKFEDMDQQLDFQQRIKLISLSIKEIKQKRNLSESQKLSNYDSILDLDQKGKIGELSFKSNIQDIKKSLVFQQDQRYSQSDNMDSSLKFNQENSLKRRSQIFFSKKAQKKMKLQQKDQKSKCQQFILELDQSITTQKGKQSQLSIINNQNQLKVFKQVGQLSQKYKRIPKKYEQLCQKYNQKCKQFSILQQSFNNIQNKLKQSEIEYNKQRIKIRQIIKNQFYSITKMKRQVEFIQNKNLSISFQRKISQIDIKVNQLQQIIIQLKTKKQKQKIKKSKLKEVQTDEIINNLINEDKQKKLHISFFINKYQNQILKLKTQKQKLKQKLTGQLSQKKLKSNMILKYTQNQCTLVLNRYIVIENISISNICQTYEVLDLDLMIGCYLQLRKVNIKQQQQKLNYFKSYKQTFDNSKSFESNFLLKNHQIYFYKNQNILILKQLPEGINLKQLCQKQKTLNQNHFRYIIKRILIITASIKKNNKIADQVVTPQKVILDNNKDIHRLAQIRLMDYGLTNFYSIDIDFNIQQNNQDYFYFPPQFFRFKNKQKILIWSLGILFYQSYYGKKPFMYDKSQLIDLQFKEELIFPSKPILSDAGKDFIKQCLYINPNLRLDITNCLKHNYLNQK